MDHNDKQAIDGLFGKLALQDDFIAALAEVAGKR